MESRRQSIECQFERSLHGLLCRRQSKGTVAYPTHGWGISRSLVVSTSSNQRLDLRIISSLLSDPLWREAAQWVGAYAQIPARELPVTIYDYVTSGPCWSGVLKPSR